MMLKVIQKYLKIRYFKKYWLSFQCVLFIVVISFIQIFCGGNEKKYPQTYDFSPEFSPPRKLYKLIKHDFDKDKLFEFAVLSVVKDASDSSINFFDYDEIQVYHWNENENRYNKILDDTVYFGSKMTIKDINSDNKDEIILYTNSGGEDSINTIGMKIYKVSEENNFKRIFDFEVGNPEFKDLDNDNIPEIILYKILYYKLTGFKKIAYISDIFKIGNSGIFTVSTPQYNNYIYSFIKNDSADYYSLKKKGNKNEVENIFKSFIRMLLGYNLLSDSYKCEFLWKVEKEFLKSISQKEQYIDLINLLQNVSINLDPEIETLISDLKVIGESYLKQKDYKNGIRIFEQILSLAPTHYDTYLQLGEIFFIIKNYNESINYYLQAMLFSVTDKKIYLGLGKSYEKNGDYNQAKLYLNKYLQYDSTSTDAIMVKELLKSKNFKGVN